MFKDIRNLIKHSGVYSIGNILSKAIGVVLIPLYTKFLTVGQFGIYAIFEVTIQLSAGILHFGLSEALFKWLSKENINYKKSNILFTSIIFILLISFFIIIPVFFLNEKLSQIVFNNSLYKGSFLVTSFLIGARLINNHMLSYIRFKEKSIFFVAATTSQFLIQLISTIYFIVYLRLGILGILLGRLSGEIILLIVQLPYILKNIDFGFKYKELKEMLKFGIPLAFSGLSGRILHIGDRYILGLLTNMSIVGMYSLGYKFANLLFTLFGSSFNKAYIPLAWKKYKKPNAKRFYSKTLTYYTFLLLWMALFISIFSKGIIHLFASRASYWDAYKIIPIILLAKVVRSQFAVIKMPLLFKNQTGKIAYIITSAAALNVGLNFILIPDFSMMGAAFATLISFLVIPSTAYLLAKRYYAINYAWKRILILFAVAFSFYFTSIIFNIFPLTFRIIVKFMLILFFPLLLYVINFYSDMEKSRIKGAFKKWLNLKKLKNNISNINLK